MNDMQEEGTFKDLHSKELSTHTGNQENQIILVEGKVYRIKEVENDIKNPMKKYI